ncbi:hypothetical protein [Actinokineospora spheciospongiae]|uniref:hypothetical protein n=1 Tax=Actinokineospora spheciospongiae TaxID=909613 RepID=UPI000D71240C|nr:hypothetical protein [Actinokineospora spheciospongiae]PWW58372.1 hypothetical protein DFQ13_109165 [Actinokineospora spheciospongiae]
MTHGENDLVQAMSDGEWFEGSADDPVVVRAGLIRELLLGRHGELDPRGVRVRGARVVGVLDLDQVRAVVGLHLADCVVEEPIRATRAVLPYLTLDGSRIAGLVADGARVDGGLFLRRVRAEGEVRLLDAHVGGQFDADDAEFTSTSGTALYATRMRLDGGFFLRRARIRGVGERGAARFVGSRFGGQVVFAGARLENPTGPVLDLHESTVDGTVFLPAEVVCPDGSREDDCDHPARVELDNFGFSSIGYLDWRQWLHLVRCHTTAYHASPYQRLAAVERAAGHDGNARRILIAQQGDLLRRSPAAVGGPVTRFSHRLWGALAGYGYRTRRTAAALLLAVTAAGLLGYAAGQVDTRPGHHAAERTVQPGSPSPAVGVACSSVELVGLGLDRGLPLGPTGLRSRCDLDTGTRWGQAFTVAIWVIQAALWGLATLALAGYTNLVRKSA